MIDITSPDFWPELFWTLLAGTWETIYMVGIAMIITLIVGLPMGIVVVGTEKGRFLEAPFGQRWIGAALHHSITFIVNLGRSVPFIVLMIALIPVTRALLGSFVGTGPAILPLTVVAIPFFVRIVEIAIREVDPGLFEAAESLGASRWLTVRRVIMPQATPSIILGSATTLTSIINFSAMVGVVGGGGLGQVAVTYGQQRYSWVHIVFVILILFVLVQAIQGVLTALAKHYGLPVPRRRWFGRRRDAQDALLASEANIPHETPTDPSLEGDRK
ncbi:methionine ABC transporter permease [uncultured Agrococcus sp.]|uniref:methionine ABC transporter permease n=1 Tax=uncultured Agrococcus sp. TaxID=382258 RepID=UPI0025F9B757|nr:methionine ABC transporter permease [uncultured Agrococcus sp.]